MDDNITEVLEHGLVREWFYGGQLAVLTVPTVMRKEMVDNWAHRVLDTIGRFPSGQPVCILHDMSAFTQGFSKYGRTWSIELYRRLPTDREMYAAYVVPDDLINRLIQNIVRTREERLKNYTERVFTERHHALNWLRKQCAISG